MGGRQRDAEQPKQVAQDEFYTQLVDVEAELRHYETSSRARSCCATATTRTSRTSSSTSHELQPSWPEEAHRHLLHRLPVAGEQLSLLDIEGAQEDAVRRAAYKIEITEVPDANSDGAIDLSDVEYLLRRTMRNVLTLLDGDGDFRSAECIALWTRPTSSSPTRRSPLFREYLSQLVEHGKQFLVLGNQNAITYNEIFKLIRENRLWLGYDNGGTNGSGSRIDYPRTRQVRRQVEDGVRYLAWGTAGSPIWTPPSDTSRMTLV